MDFAQTEFSDHQEQQNAAPLSIGDASGKPIRWVMQRKIELLTAIRTGTLTVEDACRKYRLSMDELLAWRDALNRYGPNGLLATRRYRTTSLTSRS